MIQALKKRAGSWLKVAGIYLALVLLMEGAGQLTIRYLEAKKPSGIEAENLMSYQEPVVGFALKKNLNVNLSSWHVHTDKWGFRGTETFERQKPANEKRIFLIGGSTVFGWGVNEDQSLQYYLELQIAELKKKHQNTDIQVRVINAGVPWYASWHEAAQIFFKAMEFSPDAIVVLDGLNDTALGVATSWSPLYEGYVDTPTRISYERKKQSEGGNFLVNLLKLSPTFSYFQARHKERNEAREGVYRPEVWDQYLSIMDKVVKLSHAKNVPLQFFYQPVQAVEKPITHYELTHNGTSMARPEFEATFKKQYLDGEKRVLESNLPVHSLKSVFRGNKKTIYLDGLHYNSLGNDIIAAAMWDKTIKGWVSQWLEQPAKLTAN